MESEQLLRFKISTAHAAALGGLLDAIREDIAKALSIDPHDEEPATIYSTLSE